MTRLSRNHNGRRKRSGRTPERFNWAGFIVGLVILGGAAAALLSIGAYKWSQAPSESATTTATVDACYSSRPGQACSTGDAVFTVDGTTYHTERKIPYGAHVGDQYQINYAPGCPEHNGDTRTSAIEGFAFGGIALALFAAVVTSPARYRRQSSRSRAQ